MVGVFLPALGGDTMFANMDQAYEALSEGLKSTLESLRTRAAGVWRVTRSARRLHDPRAQPGIKRAALRRLLKRRRTWI